MAFLVRLCGDLEGVAKVRRHLRDCVSNPPMKGLGIVTSTYMRCPGSRAEDLLEQGYPRKLGCQQRSKIGPGCLGAESEEWVTERS